MKKSLRTVGIIISILVGLQLVAVIYFVFSINPASLPVVAVLSLWFTNSVLVGCVVDEILKRKFNTRIYSV